MTRGVLCLLGAMWAGVVVTGNVVLFVHSATPGVAVDELRRWPEASTLALARDKPTLVVFAHPKCACTRASLSELARLTARLGPRVATYVVFVRPDGVGDAWMHTDLFERARSIDGVVAIADEEHGEAERFAARTSGTTMLFGPDGSLLFSGGLTAARGHEGASVGQERIIALVESGSSERRDAAVFGCPLDETTEPLAVRQEQR